MNSSPENIALQEQLRKGRPLTGSTPAEWREEFIALYANFKVSPKAVREPIDFGAFDGEWFRVGGAPGKAIIYFHGGGYMLGSSKSHQAIIAGIAENAGIDILVPNYRLAPEHPYPAAVDDALTVYRR